MRVVYGLYHAAVIHAGTAFCNLLRTIGISGIISDLVGTNRPYGDQKTGSDVESPVVVWS